MAKGYWIARVDVHNDEGYKPFGPPTGCSSTQRRLNSVVCS